ncbi:hypothetical protein HMPREF0298_1584 [Corynebacterium lipophiloflavum DSM 44291]|uniref:Prolipoprotein LppL n=1 Tax=Corynebacterium lipophiloflavum (strain ATCC 700352 / DSM 44291 / CCUG 37336 / JCM 10383 / DMMZ 1944) TaxID=525263 RepID=C0XT14_CORLD|nr:hypothetical protein HMPREF0298_1584 [Corynebacterium lipophiloflavum DSM 44291]
MSIQATPGYRLLESKGVITLRRCALAGTLIASAVGLSACQGATGGDVGDIGELTVNMGNAVAQPSPPATDPAGRVVDFAAVDDLDATGDTLAVRSGDSLTVGTLEQVLAGAATQYALEADCGDASAGAGSFVVACGGRVRIFDSSGERSFDTSAPASVATMTDSGDVVTGSSRDRTARMYRDGEEVSSFGVARETDQLLTVPREGAADTAVRVNHFDTTIQDLDLENARQGGTLRVGLGVGGVTTASDGLVLAADNTGSQLLVYTVSDIIRLQQSAPVAPSPWAVAWDAESALAWVTSTATNTAEGYDISQGVPLKAAEARSVADAQNMVTLDDGTLVIASASGDGLQIIAPEEKSTLKEKTS